MGGTVSNRRELGFITLSLLSLLSLGGDDDVLDLSVYDDNVVYHTLTKHGPPSRFRGRSQHSLSSRQPDIIKKDEDDGEMVFVLSQRAD